MNVAKREQDALTTARGRYCLIVCGSHKNAYSGRVFLSHQLQKIICFMVEQERDRQTERGSPGGWRSQRALFTHSSWDAKVRKLACPAGPPGTLRCQAGGQKEKPQGILIRYITSLRQHSDASSGQDQNGVIQMFLIWWMLKGTLGKISPKNITLVSTKWGCNHILS